MRIEIGNWQLQKADINVNDDKVIAVKIIANQLTEDKEGERILPEAFDDETVKEFLNIGVIDWHHQSVLAKSVDERAHAVIGKPFDFKWEAGKPVVYAYLTKSHEIVKNSILPHLDADMPVFAASVGGSKATRQVFNPDSRKRESVIPKIYWNHLAITHAPYVQNTAGGAQVSMIKAINDVYVQFSDVNEFLCKATTFFDRENELRKALEMGQSPAIEANGDPLRVQSLEGGDNGYGIFLQVILGIKNGQIPSTREGINKFLKSKGKGGLTEHFLDAIKTTMQ